MSDGQPPAKKKRLNLIFKDVLEASLEDCSLSRSFLLGESKPGLQLKVKEEKTQTSTEPSTSFCPNCVKLKRRILELEEELLRLRGEQGGASGTLTSEQTQPDQARPHPEQGPIDDFQGSFQNRI